MRYVRGDIRPPALDRQVARRGRRAYDDARYIGLRMDATYALAGHAMEGLVDLDTHRKRLAGDDDGLNMQLLDIQRTAAQAANRSVDRFARGFGF